MALNGLPVLRFLTTEDDAERMVLMAIGERAAELRELYERRLAAHVINTLGKSLKRG
jgi:flagellar biosynthesis/type III secretory pathway ATPase